MAAQRLLLVGCGKSKTYGSKEYGLAIGAAANLLANTGIREAASFLALGWGLRDMSPYYQARRAAERFDAALYRFTEQKSTSPAPPKLGKVSLIVTDKTLVKENRRGVKDGQAVASGVRLARDLGNRSANGLHSLPSCRHCQGVSESPQIAERQPF